MQNKAGAMIVGIDIGSTYIRAVGCLQQETSRLPHVIATCKKRSEGISRGTIEDKQQTADILEDVIATIEEESGYRARHILVSLGAASITSHHASGYAQVSRGDASVTDLDIDKAIKDGQKAVPDIRNKSIVHTIPLKYKIDGTDITGSIIGVHGNKLEVKTLFVTYPLQCMTVVKETLDLAHLRITDIVAGGIAESIPLLTKKQKNAGVLLVNIGSSVTSLLVYENNTPLLVSTLAVGGDDITKDIALGCKITLEDAEEVKCSRKETQSKRRVEEITDARLEDICTKINKELDRIHRRELLPAGVVVTGGSSATLHLSEVFRRELKLPITITSNELVKITKDELRDPQWARAYGLTFLAPRDGETHVFKELFETLVTRVKKIFAQFLP